MDERQRILNVIYQAIDDVNQQLPKDRRLTKSPGADLYSPSSPLDSLGAVNLILAVEERIEEEFGVAVNIADRVVSNRDNNPFRSVSTLSDYLESILQERGNAAI